MLTFAAIRTALSSAWLKFVFIAAVVGGIGWEITRGIEAIDAAGYARATAEKDRVISKLNADHVAAIAKITADQREEAARAEAAEKQKLDAQARNITYLSEQLIAANARTDALNKQLQERKTDVSTLYREKPGTALLHVPDWTVTNGWVCDYNRAIGYSVPGAGAAVGGAADAACAADPFSRSAVTAERILGHHEEYGAYCQKLEQQVNALLDHIEYVEGKTGK